ncbi:MAG: glycosyltransferase family 2 protein [Bacteroidota bacterium]|jgi:glycosyltransferase involved in cell wall biosynthesis
MISLIITCHNYAQYLERAIRSSLEQSLNKEEFEIIVINDASTDATAEILLNYEDSCRVFNLDKNIGLAGARNFGVKKARGQFILFLDADDYIHSELLRIQRLFLFENREIDAVAVDYFLVDEKGAHLEHVSCEKNPIACGIMFRKDYLFQIGLYDESFNAREEEDLRIRWEHAGLNIYAIPLPLYRYRMHESNLTKNNQKMSESAIQLKNKHSK